MVLRNIMKSGGLDLDEMLDANVEETPQHPRYCWIVRENATFSNTVIFVLLTNLVDSKTVPLTVRSCVALRQSMHHHRLRLPTTHLMHSFWNNIQHH